ncbi:metallophosphoesterase [Sphingomonas sp. 28-63-12]|uniref:metallophosphoesterase family protein n=1 Tax=Sphingomonas sp. 28-63-12 TaxID=1970434 RepID=UPI000BCDD643|nr:MAG: metallophosphoesterase [Sphingomonas sp. 28-63-12]
MAILRRVLGSTLAVATALAATPSFGQASPSTKRGGDLIKAGYVVMGPQGIATARVITEASKCPPMLVDGHAVPMTVRSPPGTAALRPTLSTAENSKASVFNVLTCEAVIASGARRISVAGHRLPAPPKLVRRIVVIGDTGCRMKASDNAYQACNDARAFPFARLAHRAAAARPDLILHVGDYHYRENPCPVGNAGCAGSPWGYGWAAWQADFFRPARPLLAAAPLIVVRGNHENCARAGQGWWRFLDPGPLQPGRDCNDPANDHRGDNTPPYAVPLGHDTQVIVLDLASAGSKPLAADDPLLPVYQDSYRRMAALAKGAVHSFVANHKPILGVGVAGKTATLSGGNAAIQSAFASLNPQLLPDGVDVLLSGHIHLWEQLGFASDHPSQFVAGFSGTEEDKVPLPSRLPASFSPAPGAVIGAFSSWVDGFGYMTMDRLGSGRWKIRVWNLAGSAVNTCVLNGRKSQCRYDRVPASAGR